MVPTARSSPEAPRCRPRSRELRDAGYLPAAIRNYVALLGWGPATTKPCSTAELIERFRPEDVGRSSAVFDEKKLRWMNGRYVRNCRPANTGNRCAPSWRPETVGRPLNEDRFAFGCEIVQEKAQTLQEVWPLIRFLFEPPVQDEKAWRKA